MTTNTLTKEEQLASDEAQLQWDMMNDTDFEQRFQDHMFDYDNEGDSAHLFEEAELARSLPTKENTMTVLTNEVTPVIDLTTINKSAIVSTMGAELFQAGLNTRLALLASVAFIGAVDYHDDDEMFLEAFIDGLEVTSLEVIGHKTPDDIINGEEILNVLIAANYLTEDIKIGKRLAELVALRKEAYYPPLASEGIDRRHMHSWKKLPPLSKESILALEDTPFTVDVEQLSIEMQVVAATGGEDEDLENYVIQGCLKMDDTLGYVSEFKPDARDRKYQASCRGPNGQSSDRSRALMDLHGVDMDYDPVYAMTHLKEEMSDMVSAKDRQTKINLVRQAMADPVAFIIKHQAIKDDPLQDTLVSKPHSFVKASRIMIALSKHIRNSEDFAKPYIGMAFGYDAKCSGPQLGSLMVGDAELAAACGFSMEQLNDAYHRAIEALELSGFHGIRRADIKKPYMGIFYGQGIGAYMDPNNEDIQGVVWESMYQGKFEQMNAKQVQAIAKRFHEAVVASFGAKMVMVRNAFKSYTKKVDGKISHYMPSGFKVQMNYKQKVNILGEAIEYDTDTPDVRLTNNAETYKFINFAMRTKEVHTGDFVRNGFVNMIQATDALMATLIIINCKRLGAKHIISVHDCFRVSINELEILQEAIKLTYLELFGTKKNVVTEDLPLGTDILGMYFDGINKSLKDGEEGTYVSQFFKSGTRRIQKVHGHTLDELICALGTTYYFAK